MSNSSFHVHLNEQTNIHAHTHIPHTQKETENTKLKTFRVEEGGHAMHKAERQDRS